MTHAGTTAPSAPPNLLARAFGVIFSPRETYASIVRRPKVLGAMLAVVVIIAGVQYAFLSTEIGQRAMVDQNIDMMESFGVTISDQQLANMERGASRGAIFAVISIFVFVPVVQMIMAGLVLVVFNAVLGGEAGFKQVLAIVVHGGFIGALQVLFVTPLNYLNESMASATSLAVFLPMLDATSFIGRLAGSIDFFRIWSTVSLAIGLGVLYKRRTSPIAWSLLAVYFVIIIVIAGVRAALSGA